MRQQGHIFVISAPSGTGKSTLIAHSCEELPRVWHSISATTRPRRALEEDGVHYHFLKKSDFHEMITKNEFLEWAHVYGEYYGTPQGDVEAHLSRGDDVIMDLDVQGALQIKRRRADASLIFVMPPSLDALRDRLKGRATESDEKMESRLSEAEEEMTQRYLYDHVIINDDMEAAFRKLRDLLLKRRGEGNPR